MSNEHLSQVGESAAGQSFDGDGPDIDEGPLDPSVFFGLFDDLGENSESEPEAEPVAERDPAGAVEVTEEGGHDAEVDTVDIVEPEIDPAEPDTVDIVAPEVDPAESNSPDRAEATAEPDPDTPETPPAMISGSSTAPDEQQANGRGISVASPPPIPPGVGRPRTIESLSPADTTETIDGGLPPVVSFTPIGIDRSSNGSDARVPHSTETSDVAGSVARTETAPAVDRSALPIESGSADVDRGGTMAKAALATIAVGLFAGLIVAFTLSVRSPDPALSGSAAGETETRDPAASTVVDEAPAGLAQAIASGTRPTAELLAAEFATALPAAISTRLDLTSLRFEPGTTELDERSTAVVSEVGALLAERPTIPVTISVRTYTESTPAGNLALSSDQADALVTSLVTAGAAPDQVRGRGLGAAPLSQGQPVPNFVAITPQFGDRRLDRALADLSPFAVGVPATATDDIWPLRPDGLLGIGEIAETLSAFPDTEVGAAGYSFLPPSQEGIRAEADTAAVELADFLVTTYGVDPGQITTIIPGSAVFVPTAEHGNHIWLQIGPASQGAFEVASIDPAAITFQPGSAALDAQGLANVGALADILTDGGATIVVDVRSYEAADAAANQALSETRRDALTRALTDAGVAPEQLRMYASGASSYFLADGGSAITITVAP